MELSFADRDLRALVMESVADDWPSEEIFDDVRILVADLRAASSLLEIPLGLPDLGEANVSGFELSASDRVVFVCRVDHVPVRFEADGRPAWAQINRMMITAWKDLGE